MFDALLRRIAAMAPLAAASLFTGGAHAEHPEQADVARLADGRARRSNWQPPGVADRYGRAEVLVHAPLAVVHKAVLDFPRYKDLVPSRFHVARVLGREGDGTDVYMQLPILHGMVTLWQVMRFRDLKPLAPGWAIVEGWSIRGNLKAGNIAWTMHAIDDDYTVLTCDLLVLPNVPAPQVIVDEELRDAAAQAVEGIRDVAQSAPGPARYSSPSPAKRAEAEPAERASGAVTPR
jgi:hypothetical protein